jgi:hypothetical protein
VERRARRAVVASLLGLVALSAAPLEASAQSSEERFFHNTTFLPDPNAPEVRAVEKARTDLASGDVQAVVRSLAAALEGADRDLYARIGMRTLAPIHAAAERILVDGGHELRRTFRAAAEPRAAEALVEAGRERTALLGVARRYPMTAAGARALLLASDSHRVEARPRAAIRLLRHLLAWIDRAAEDGVPIPTGDANPRPGRAPSAAMPTRQEVEASLDAAERLLDQLGPDPSRRVLVDVESLGAGSQSGPPVSPRIVPRFSVQLSDPLRLPAVAREGRTYGGFSFERLPILDPGEARPSFPLHVGSVVYAQDHESLIPISLSTHRLAYEGAGGVEFVDRDLFLPDRLAPDDDRLWFHLAAADRFLLLTHRSRSLAAPTQSRLFAFDRSRDSYLVWEWTGRAGVEDASPVHLPSPPVAIDGRLYLPFVRGEGTLDVHVAALALETGRLAWERYAGSAAPVLPHPERVEPTHVEAPLPESSPPATDGSLAVFVSNLGFVAAVDPAWEEVAWIYLYHRVSPEPEGKVTPEVLYDVTGWDLGEILFDGERFVVAPADSRHLYALASEPDGRGDLLVAEPIARDRLGSLLAVRDGRLLFTAWRGANRTIVETDLGGNVTWESDPLPPGEFLAGRGVAAGPFVYVPTTGGISVFAPGGPTAAAFRYSIPGVPRSPHPPFAGLGNLLAVPGGIVSAGPFSFVYFAYEGETR